MFVYVSVRVGVGVCVCLCVCECVYFHVFTRTQFVLVSSDTKQNSASAQ